MKIHVFPRERSSEEWDDIRNQVESDVTDKLKSFGVDKDLRVSHVAGPKIRFLFNMNERDDARKLYKDIAKNSGFFGQNIAATIFYVKSEQVFCEHADREAKLFYEQEETRKAQQEERRKKQGDKPMRQEGGRN